MSKHIVHVVGTRPQFPKVAPVYRALDGLFKQTVIHTGQHYDDRLSKEIIEDTGCHIDVTFPQKTSSGREVSRLARRDVLQGFLEMHEPDLVMVYGDCNTSLGAAQAAVNTRTKFAHVEAGLRCWDHRMIEEINRVEIDRYADILYVPSVDAVYNLAREGRFFKDIQFVGNVMADSYQWMKARCTNTFVDRHDFALVTMHRPENVDDEDFMYRFLTTLSVLDFPLIFPKHPRVKLPFVPDNVEVVGPSRYTTFARWVHQARFVITDSGGVQEETTLAHTPCLTVRPNTERPVTITEGTNELACLDTLPSQVSRVRAGGWKRGSIPMYWDGKAAERIACHLRSYLL